MPTGAILPAMPGPAKFTRRPARHLPRDAAPIDRDPRDGLDADMLALLRRLDEIPYIARS